jgi:hypothetical protein
MERKQNKGKKSGGIKENTNSDGWCVLWFFYMLDTAAIPLHVNTLSLNDKPTRKPIFSFLLIRRL